MVRRLLATLAVALSACTTSAPAPQPVASSPAPSVSSLAPPPRAPSWSEGVAAFHRARSARAPLLAYVSSSWCPPCRALEANVLSRPEFLRAAAGLTLVKIPGDEEGAQAIVELLEAWSYPALVLLSADGEELFRAHSAVGLEELAPALRAAVLTGGLRGARERLDRGAPTADDCSLFAALDGGLAKNLRGDPVALAKAFGLCARSPRETRVRMGAQALALASVGTNEQRAAIGDPSALVDAILEDDASAWAARATVSTFVKPVFAWLAPEPGPRRAALAARWARAARAVRDHPAPPVDAWARSHQAFLDLERVEHPSGPLPAALAKELVGAAERVDALAKTPSERHGAIGQAAYYLRAAGEKKRAAAMLEAEVARSDDPTHDLVTLSEWALDDGDRALAKRFAREAVVRARGRASRLQWLAHELTILAKDLRGRTELFQRAGEAYALLFEKDDAFVGRNAKRAKELAATLSPLRGDAAMRAIVSTHSAKCASLPEASRRACADHFESFRP